MIDAMDALRKWSRRLHISGDCGGVDMACPHCDKESMTTDHDRPTMTDRQQDPLVEALREAFEKGYEMGVEHDVPMQAPQLDEASETLATHLRDRLDLDGEVVAEVRSSDMRT